MDYPIAFGRYWLTQKLASGGMAEIFKAKLVGIEGFEKTLAIKRILPSWSEHRDFVAMLIDEAKVLVHLNHPNIVQVYELGKVDQNYFIAMEYVEGVDLRRFTNQAKILGKSLPEELAIYITIQTLQGLGYAHERSLPKQGNLGIVHRDISPQNILISLNGEVKVTDFGIAKAITQSHETQTGVLKGKYAYMSPEQAQGKELEGRSDLFSCAIILYELLLHERLFATGNDLKTLDKVRRAEISWEIVRSSPLSENIQKILQKALAANPSQRFQSAREFSEALEDCLPQNQKLGTRNLAGWMQELFAEEFLAPKDPDQDFFKPQASKPKTLVSDPVKDKTVSLVKNDSFHPTSENIAPQNPVSIDLGKTSKSKKIFLSLMILVLPLLLGILGYKKWHRPTLVVPAVQNPVSRPNANTDEPSTNPMPKPKIVTSPIVVSASPAEAEISLEYQGQQKSALGKLNWDNLPLGDLVLLKINLKGYDSYEEKITIKPENQYQITLKKSEPKFGTLSINSDPWALVDLPGYWSGKSTPLGPLRLPEGKYSLRVYRPGIGVDLHAAFSIRANKNTVCKADFKEVTKLKCD